MSLLFALLLPTTQAAAAVPVDFSAVGPAFDGVGALSGGGGTSRLLYDYEEPYRAQILDALFLPESGGALQILKVEIGGDGQSTEATEASHMHTQDEEPNFNRGYEWWLMKEAKARNPEIKLFGLAWTAPGWLGTSEGKPGEFFSQDNIDYHMKWIKGAKSEHNLTIDYMRVTFAPAFSSAQSRLPAACMSSASRHALHHDSEPALGLLQGHLE